MYKCGYCGKEYDGLFCPGCGRMADENMVVRQPYDQESDETIVDDIFSMNMENNASIVSDVDKRSKKKKNVDLSRLAFMCSIFPPFFLLGLLFASIDLRSKKSGDPIAKSIFSFLLSLMWVFVIVRIIFFHGSAQIPIICTGIVFIIGEIIILSGSSYKKVKVFFLSLLLIAVIAIVLYKISPLILYVSHEVKLGADNKQLAESKKEVLVDYLKNNYNIDCEVINAELSHYDHGISGGRYIYTFECVDMEGRKFTVRYEAGPFEEMNGENMVIEY